MLDVLAEEHPSHGGVSYLSALSRTDLSGLRIGVPTSRLLRLSGAPMDAFHKALQLLESCGATIVHDADYAGLDEFNKLSEENNFWSPPAISKLTSKNIFVTSRPTPILSTTSVTLFGSQSRVRRKNTLGVA
jgi:Asp-tRNA(Asn)/Glu-tRNA(Gln) amidotransferase A subunit family amidase